MQGAVGKLTILLAYWIVNVLVLQPRGAATLTLAITPRHAITPIRSDNATVTITCLATRDGGGAAPLAACQILNGAEIIDLSQGAASAQHPDYKYQGAGLEQGECGVTLGGRRGWGNVMIGCRVREAAGGGWHYNAMVLDVSNFKDMRFDLLGPRQVVAWPGSDVTILGHADMALDRCRFQLSDTFWLDFNQGPNSPSTPDLSYHGKGLLDMECGISMKSVTSDRSGFVRVSVKHPAPSPAEQAFRGIDYVTLIVATPPEPPRLTLPSTTFNMGETLHATCVVANSRPVSNVTWFLGDAVVRQDAVDDAAPDASWRWPHEAQTVTQHLSRELLKSDDGKAVRCQAGHVALPGGTADSEAVVLRVRSRRTCEASPCGPNSACRPTVDDVTCSCLPGYIGEPPSCRPECQESSECPPERACVEQKCVESCQPGPCGEEALCRVQDHYPVCACPAGSAGDPYVRCEPGCPSLDAGPSEVALPPKLKLTQSSSPRGDFLVASCVVRQCFVVANITWLLGDEVLQYYLVNDSPDDVEPAPEMAPLVKQLRRKLGARDNGRELKCQVTYFGVEQPQTSKAFIHLQCTRLELSQSAESVLPPELVLNVTRYTEGEMLQATCIVRQCYVVDSISWFLGAKMLEYYYVGETPGEVADPAETRPITQQLSRRLTWRDNGKELKCRVSYAGVKQPQMNAQLLVVKFKDAPDISAHPNVRLVNSDLCGHVAVDVAIAFGKNSDLFQYPWMALLILNADSSNPQYICGASVINNNYLLTAAHCVTPASKIPRANLFCYFPRIEGTSSGRIILPVETSVAQNKPRPSYVQRAMAKQGYFENYFKYNF